MQGLVFSDRETFDNFLGVTYSIRTKRHFLLFAPVTVEKTIEQWITRIQKEYNMIRNMKERTDKNTEINKFENMEKERTGTKMSTELWK